MCGILTDGGYLDNTFLEAGEITYRERQICALSDRPYHEGKESLQQVNQKFRLEAYFVVMRIDVEKFEVLDVMYMGTLYVIWVLWKTREERKSIGTPTRWNKYWIMSGGINTENPKYFARIQFLQAIS